jgi:hypothetical protein
VSGRVTIPCAGCKNQVDTWFECCKDCRYQIGFCKDCGGAKKASREMMAHKAGCHPSLATVPPSCDGNPYAHADVIDGGTCSACGCTYAPALPAGSGVAEKMVPMPGVLWEPKKEVKFIKVDDDRTDTGFIKPDGTWQALCCVCAKKVDPGRRCCDGIGECWRTLHERDRRERWREFVEDLARRFNLPIEVIRQITKAARRF